jgi:hypothetical protein
MEAGVDRQCSSRREKGRVGGLDNIEAQVSAWIRRRSSSHPTLEPATRVLATAPAIGPSRGRSVR